MVMLTTPVHDPLVSTAAINMDNALRGMDVEKSLEDVKKEIDSWGFKICKFTMDKCSISLKQDRVCTMNGTCSDADVQIGIPVRAWVCSVACEYCHDDRVNNLLNILYKAGAITTSDDLARKIDNDIQELNELKHKMKTVSITTELNKAKVSIDAYLHNTYGKSNTDDKIKEKTITEPDLNKVVENEDVKV